MRKQFYFLLLVLAFCLHTSAQFQLKIETEEEKMETSLKDKQTIPINKKPTAILLKRDKDDKTYIITKGDEIKAEFKGDGEFHSINFEKVEFNPEDKKSGAIQINEKGAGGQPLITFQLLVSNNTEANGRGGNEDIADNDLLINPITLQQFVDLLGFDLNNLELKQYGIIVTSGNTPYVGNRYVHIFLDQYGNSIYGTIPQGISDRQYVVHVFYQTGTNVDLQVFDVKKTKGSFNPALNFLNTTIHSENPELKSKRLKEPPYTWVHKEFLIATSTTDIGFDLTRTTIEDATKPYVYKNEKIGSYAINMTPIYHGSFNFGFVDSRLENPTYELLTNPSNTAENVVKAKEGSNRGIVTVMATVYTSPIILIEKAFKGKDIPWNKTYGRNFLDDHRFFERIYPAIGVGFSDKVFENIFYGFNWEAVRGAGLFLGWHWGKINTFRTEDDFKFEKTVMTQEEFNLRSDKKWSTRFAIGVNVDPIVVARLFGSGVLQ